MCFGACTLRDDPCGYAGMTRGLVFLSKAKNPAFVMTSTRKTGFLAALRMPNNFRGLLVNQTAAAFACF